MSITANINDEKNALVITVPGRFDFSKHNEFRKAYKDIKMESGVYEIDLHSTDYLDSSALGMMLMLKEVADSNSSVVKITHANDELREILRIASFEKLFVIE